MALEVTYIGKKKCYSFEKGNRFFSIARIEYEILGSETIIGDDSWQGVKHKFKKRFPGPEDDKDDRWEAPMAVLTKKILLSSFSSL